MTTEFKTISVRLEKQEVDEFKKIAIDNNTSMSDMLREFIRDVIKEETKE